MQHALQTMSVYPMPDPLLVKRKRRRVETWLSSLLDADDGEGNSDCDRRDHEYDGKLSKRIRLTSSKEGSGPSQLNASAPETPLLTADEAGAEPDAMSSQPEPPHTPITARIASRRKRDGDVDGMI